MLPVVAAMLPGRVAGDPASVQRPSGHPRIDRRARGQAHKALNWRQSSVGCTLSGEEVVDEGFGSRSLARRHAHETPVPPLEGKVVRVTLEPLDEDEASGFPADPEIRAALLAVLGLEA